ncbi:MAG: tRNA 4-thiouridine(8) synthase ThiI [Candidatus Omnitrophica bacterium]|nr:tRNA 4-thiouridine(8) synthase ThiI [Candidatus Omnitrophota bacterium]
MKAIALVSGGLDSLLAAKIIQGQEIEVIGMRFNIPFYIRKPSSFNTPDLEIIREDIGSEFLKIVLNPSHGFGSNINPCIDCKILMLTSARGLMPKLGAKFIITGEVLGQRPMSQHKRALDTIAREAGLEGLVLRPLSARLLSQTIPEKEGWVDRNRLFDINGRGRKTQIRLAAQLGIKEYAQPAGGCLLTDPAFSARLKDLILNKELSGDKIELLKIGRHFRLSPQLKLIVGRNESENKELQVLAQKGGYLFAPLNIAGPAALVKGELDEGAIGLCASIVARYCDKNGDEYVEVAFSDALLGKERIIKALPLEEKKLSIFRV